MKSTLKQCVLSVFLFVSVLSGFSQQWGLGNDFSLISINEKREFIIKQIKANKYTDLKKQVNEINAEIDSSKYIAFQPWEIQMMSLLANDINWFIEGGKSYNQRFRHLLYVEDSLSVIGKDHFYKDLNSIKEWIAKQELNADDKIAFSLFYSYLYPDNFNDFYYKECKRFINEYPESVHLEFVDVLKRNYLQGSVAFEIGHTWMKLNGPISTIVSDFSGFTFALNGTARRNSLSIFYSDLKNNNAKPFEVQVNEAFSDSFRTVTTQPRCTNYGLKYGIQLFHGEGFQLVPYTTISIMDVYISGKSLLNDTQYQILNKSIGVGAGARITYELLSWNSSNQMFTSNKNQRIGLIADFNYQGHFGTSNYVNGSGLQFNFSVYWRTGS